MRRGEKRVGGMKKVVVLQGPPTCGKTLTLKSALRVLTEKKAKVKAQYRWRGEMPVLDVWAVLDVCGKNVFFSTADGASIKIEEQFAEALECAELKKEQIDVFVFPVRETGRGKRLLNNVVAKIGTKNALILQKRTAVLGKEQIEKNEADAQDTAAAVIAAASDGVSCERV